MWIDKTIRIRKLNFIFFAIIWDLLSIFVSIFFEQLKNNNKIVHYFKLYHTLYHTVNNYFIFNEIYMFKTFILKIFRTKCYAKKQMREKIILKISLINKIKSIKNMLWLNCSFNLNILLTGKLQHFNRQLFNQEDEK